jgi:hypothetical protein
MVDAMGDPGTPSALQQAIEIMFSLSCRLEFMIKKPTAIDHIVTALPRLMGGRGAYVCT